MNISIPLYPEGNDDKTVATSIKNIIHMKLEKKLNTFERSITKSFYAGSVFLSMRQSWQKRFPQYPTRTRGSTDTRDQITA